MSSVAIEPGVVQARSSPERQPAARHREARPGSPCFPATFACGTDSVARGRRPSRRRSTGPADEPGRPQPVTRWPASGRCAGAQRRSPGAVLDLVPELADQDKTAGGAAPRHPGSRVDLAGVHPGEHLGDRGGLRTAPGKVPRWPPPDGENDRFADLRAVAEDQHGTAGLNCAHSATSLRPKLASQHPTSPHPHVRGVPEHHTGVAEPGLWMQWEWRKGPRVDRWPTNLRCAWSAWS